MNQPPTRPTRSPDPAQPLRRAWHRTVPFIHRHMAWSKFTVDLVAWSLTLPLAFLLHDFGGSVARHDDLILLSAIAIPLYAFLIHTFGFHRQSWVRVSVRDLFAILAAVTISTAVLWIETRVLERFLDVPVTIPIIAGFAAVVVLGGVRLGVRLVGEHERSRGLLPDETRNVLIAGAGDAGTLLVREMHRHPELGLRPVGFLDDDPSKQRMELLGVPVVGRLRDLGQQCLEREVDEVIIAMPSAPGRIIREVVDQAQRARVRSRIVPPVTELLKHEDTVSQLREVDLADLLRRAPIELDLDEISSYLEGRVVLVTGAAGSIGAEIVRQVTRFDPERIIILDWNENGLYELERELEHAHPELSSHTVVADVRDLDQVARIFDRYRPEVVFHAAAHKHVPLMERHPHEAVLNNVQGTLNMVKLTLRYNVPHFVNISTDKAVNPTSVMGATKRIGELVVAWGADRAQPGQSFSSVRFGNVLGSQGSVVPLWREQIRQGGPVTVTHEGMTRYFMLIPEAAQLVLQAGGFCENGSLYVLDMGEPVRIMDMAKDLVRLCGFEPGEDIEIQVTGSRPGEKLYEELMSEAEGIVSSRHEKIMIAPKDPAPEGLEKRLMDLFDTARQRGPAEDVREAIQRLVPTYAPPGSGPGGTAPVEPSSTSRPSDTTSS